MARHVPDEKSKTVIFWLEHEVQYLYGLYKKNLKIPSVGKGVKERQSLVNFLDYFKKISNIVFCQSFYYRDFFETVWKVGYRLPSLSHLSHGGNLGIFLVQSKHMLNFILKPKNSHFRFFIGDTTDQVLSLALLIKIKEECWSVSKCVQ